MKNGYFKYADFEVTYNGCKYIITCNGYVEPETPPSYSHGGIPGATELEIDSVQKKKIKSCITFKESMQHLADNPKFQQAVWDAIAERQENGV